MQRFLPLLALLVLALPTSALAQADRSQAPKPSTLRPLQLPATQQFTLANGLRVYLVEKHSLPLVAMKIVVNAGSRTETPEQLGIAGMTARLLKQGAGSRDALAFADEEAFLGIRISSYSSTEAAYVDLFALRNKLEAGLGLVRDMLTAPRFAAEELDRKRKESLAGLIQAHDQPPAIASRAWSQALAGATHPLGRPSAGTEATLKAMTADQVKAYFQAWYTPANSFAVIVGDVDAAAARQLLEAALGGWQGGAKAAPVVAAPPQPKGLRILLVDKPGAAQSVIRIGRVGVPRNTPDYANLEVMNTILGGSFTSRLNTNLREKNNYAYGAGSGFSQLSTTGTFTASTNVQTDKTGPALNEMLKELRAIRVLQPAEVEKARNYVALSFPQNFADVEQIASMEAARIQYNLPADEYATMTTRLLAVQPKGAMAAASKYVDASNLVIVVVGDRAKVESQLQALKLPITVQQVTDVLGPVPTL